ncbi:MAG: hypothetical protein KC413_22400, partial [Anaerolineales bacterium]|nr:hypothetical protein [Anaerolineales bacterium]
GPDGDIFISNLVSDEIVHYDLATGTTSSIALTTGAKPNGLTFGPDGNLYINARNLNQVLRYNVTTSAISTFVGSDSLNRPEEGIEFGPDGNLYVASFNTNEVRRYNGTTGVFIDAFVTGLSGPRDIEFGPDGYLYVSNYTTNEVRRYNASTGADAGAFITGLSGATGLIIGPDNYLYVTEYTADRVSRFDLATGAPISTFGSTASIDQPKEIVFTSELDCYDYGDAPNDGSSYFYPTESTANGAYHLIRPSLFLGAGVDYDADGQSDLAALGDDSDNNDDEDGVDFGTLTAGAANNVTVTASAPCILNAWIDFDGDGSWSGVGEQVAADQWISGGANILTVNVPASPAEDVVGARFRCSSRSSEGNTVYSYTGYAPDGEVEDYMVAIGTDWGDAPDSYNTTSANNGASHTIVSNFHLGGIIDPETSGSDSVATGDDLLDNRDDEDGVDFVGNWADGTAEINVSLTGGRGCLNIWLDFTDGTNLLVNGDGDFLDTYTVGGTFPEHVVQNQAVDSANSPISLAFNIPAGIANGSTGYYLRARLTQDPNNDGNCADAGSEYSGGIVSHSGGATSGEVEDYYVDFEPTAVSLQTIGTESTAHNVFAIAGFALLLLGTAFAILRRQRFSD